MREDFEPDAIEPIESMADDKALMQTVRLANFGQPKTTKQIMAEFEAQREDDLTELAQTVRLEMQIEEDTRKIASKQVTDQLSSEEAAAERRVKRKD
jgi:hypothetical protein